MFERRVKTILAVLAAAMIVLFVRLIDLQIIHANEFRQQAADALLLPAQSLPFVRGQILDRLGTLLASDKPTWDIMIDYGLLAENEDYLAAMRRRYRRMPEYKDQTDAAVIERVVEQDIAQMWQELAYFGGRGQEELRARSADITNRIKRIRQLVARNRGFDAPIAEELLPHSVVAGLDDQQQVEARRMFERYPWIKIQASTGRVYSAEESLGHLLGRTKPVDAEQLESDPFVDDEFRRYRGDETYGFTGVEYSAESMLRGRRGVFHKNRKGEVLQDVEPQDGQEVHLTIRVDLQAALYDLLIRELPSFPYSPGGSIVVLDVATRDVLALVSCPGYDPNLFQSSYAELRDDSIQMPLRFRAVSNIYNPGSIIKPLTCLAGLGAGVITLETRYDCSGYLFPEQPLAGASKCWTIPGTSRRKSHGPVDVVKALEGSCNIFMYKIGQSLGVDPLCSYFQMAGIGQPSGINLLEESIGINPYASVLSHRFNRRVQRADPRLFAIGQAEVAVTPIQAANLMATIADGQFRKVRLIQSNPLWPVDQLPVSEHHWQAIREGLFGVVNAADGTAQRYAFFEHPMYALAGKTGSATTKARPVRYRIDYQGQDGQKGFTVLPGGSKREVKDVFELSHPEVEVPYEHIKLIERYPPHLPAGGGNHAHAWFACFLQSIDERGRPRYEVLPRIALAVLVEFGGSGGRASGSIAKKAAQIIIDTLGDELDPDHAADMDP